MTDYTDKVFDDDKSQHQKERQQKRDAIKQKKLEEEQRRNESRERLGKVAKKTLIFALIGLVILLALFGRLIWQIRELSKQREESLENLNKLNEKIEELEGTLDRVTSLDYIEEQARSQLRMIYPGEVLYVVDE